MAHQFDRAVRTQDVHASEKLSFEDLHLNPYVSKGLTKAGFERPSPIQLKAIPLGRCGLDLIVQAKSGTGKTCVFTVIALDALDTKSNATQALVLAPTREIAVQIQQVVQAIGVAMVGLKCHTFIGGLPVKDDITKLARCHIAIGTPGRVKQLIDEGHLSVDSVRLFVLDEADKLMQQDFQEVINWIYSSLPDNKQMIALSATYPEVLAQHLTAYMRNPTFIRLNASDPALLGIRQYYATVQFGRVQQLIYEKKTSMLFTILSSVHFNQCLVFSNYQLRAQSLCDALNAKGWPAAHISGARDQTDRLSAMAQLKQYECRVLVSTDLTARGIDAENVNLVINLDIPSEHETYLHRIGRAGRFGTYGAGISIIGSETDKRLLKEIEVKCKTTIKELPDPIPDDLARSSGFVHYDDLVTTEALQSNEQNSENNMDSKVQLISKPNPVLVSNNGTNDPSDLKNHKRDSKAEDDSQNKTETQISSRKRNLKSKTYTKVDQTSSAEITPEVQGAAARPKARAKRKQKLHPWGDWLMQDESQIEAQASTREQRQRGLPAELNDIGLNIGKSADPLESEITNEYVDIGTELPDKDGSPNANILDKSINEPFKNREFLEIDVHNLKSNLQTLSTQPVSVSQPCSPSRHMIPKSQHSKSTSESLSQGASASLSPSHDIPSKSGNDVGDKLTGHVIPKSRSLTKGVMRAKSQAIYADTKSDNKENESQIEKDLYVHSNTKRSSDKGKTDFRVARNISSNANEYIDSGSENAFYHADSSISPDTPQAPRDYNPHGRDPVSYGDMSLFSNSPLTGGNSPSGSSKNRFCISKSEHSALSDISPDREKPQDFNPHNRRAVSYDDMNLFGDSPPSENLSGAVIRGVRKVDKDSREQPRSHEFYTRKVGSLTVDINSESSPQTYPQEYNFSDDRKTNGEEKPRDFNPHNRTPIAYDDMNLFSDSPPVETEKKKKFRISKEKKEDLDRSDGTENSQEFNPHNRCAVSYDDTHLFSESPKEKETVSKGKLSNNKVKSKDKEPELYSIETSDIGIGESNTRSVEALSTPTNNSLENRDFHPENRNYDPRARRAVVYDDMDMFSVTPSPKVDKKRESKGSKSSLNGLNKSKENNSTKKTSYRYEDDTETVANKISDTSSHNVSCSHSQKERKAKICSDINPVKEEISDKNVHGKILKKTAEITKSKTDVVSEEEYAMAKSKLAAIIKAPKRVTYKPMGLSAALTDLTNFRAEYESKDPSEVRKLMERTALKQKQCDSNEKDSEPLQVEDLKEDEEQEKSRQEITAMVDIMLKKLRPDTYALLDAEQYAAALPLGRASVSIDQTCFENEQTIAGGDCVTCDQHVSEETADSIETPGDIIGIKQRYNDYKSQETVSLTDIKGTQQGTHAKTHQSIQDASETERKLVSHDHKYSEHQSSLVEEVEEESSSESEELNTGSSYLTESTDSVLCGQCYEQRAIEAELESPIKLCGDCMHEITHAESENDNDEGEFSDGEWLEDEHCSEEETSVDESQTESDPSYGPDDSELYENEDNSADYCPEHREMYNQHICDDCTGAKPKKAAQKPKAEKDYNSSYKSRTYEEIHPHLSDYYHHHRYYPEEYRNRSDFETGHFEQSDAESRRENKARHRADRTDRNSSSSPVQHDLSSAAYMYHYYQNMWSQSMSMYNYQAPCPAYSPYLFYHQCCVHQQPPNYHQQWLPNLYNFPQPAMPASAFREYNAYKPDRLQELERLHSEWAAFYKREASRVHNERALAKELDKQRKHIRSFVNEQ